MGRACGVSSRVGIGECTLQQIGDTQRCRPMLQVGAVDVMGHLEDADDIPPLTFHVSPPRRNHSSFDNTVSSGDAIGNRREPGATSIASIRARVAASRSNGHPFETKTSILNIVASEVARRPARHGRARMIYGDVVRRRQTIDQRIDVLRARSATRSASRLARAMPCAELATEPAR